MTDDTRRDPAPAHQRAGRESLLDLARSIWRELPALVGDRVELLSLELQRAGHALVKVAVLAGSAVILALTAWLALWGTLVGLLIALGWPAAAAHALVVLINALATAWALWRARSLLKLLGLPATRRHLMVGLHQQPAGVVPRQESVDERGAAAVGSAATR